MEFNINKTDSRTVKGMVSIQQYQDRQYCRTVTELVSIPRHSRTVTELVSIPRQTVEQ